MVEGYGDRVVDHGRRQGWRNDSDAADLIDAAATLLEPDAAVVHVRGEVDGFTVLFARQAINEAFSLGISRLLIDLDGVVFFGSAGMGLLLQTRKRALDEKVGLGLVCSNSLVMRPLGLAGLSELFVVSDSVETALGPFPS